MTETPPSVHISSTRRSAFAWFSGLALIGGLIVDTVTIYQLVHNRFSARGLLSFAVALTALFLVSAIYLLRAKTTVRIPDDHPSEDRPDVRKQLRYQHPSLRVASKAVAWAAGGLLVVLVVTWGVLRIVPPRNTVILITKFTNPSGVDEARVTRNLVAGIRQVIADNSASIKVKALDNAIPNEDGNGSAIAREIGARVEHKASIIIWGDYLLNPEPELEMHFEILRSPKTYLGTGVFESYQPPDFLQFRLDLGQHLGMLAAFAVGLALYEDGQNLEAIPLLETAGNMIGTALGSGMERAVRLYRGVNYLTLARAGDADADLRILVEDQKWSHSPDAIWRSALGNLGLVANAMGDYASARTYLGEALELYAELDSTLGQAQTLSNLGIVASDQGDYASARTYHEDSLKLHTELGNRLGMAANLGNLGNVATIQGDYALAHTYHEDALKLHTELGNRLGVAADLGNLGLVAFVEGDYASARSYHEDSLNLHTELGNRLGMAANLSNLGLVATNQGDYAAARDYYENSLNLHTELGNRLGMANDLGNLGQVAYFLDDFAAARDYVQRAHDLFELLDNRLGMANQLGNLGMVAHAQGDEAAARNYFQRSYEQHKILDDRLGMGNNLSSLGEQALSDGDFASAQAYFVDALKLHTELGYRLGMAIQLHNLGILFELEGDFVGARSHYVDALQLQTELGDRYGMVRTLASLGIMEKGMGNREAACQALLQSAALQRGMGIEVYPRVDQAITELGCAEE